MDEQNQSPGSDLKEVNYWPNHIETISGFVIASLHYN